MSDALYIHAKLDSILSYIAGLPTGDDLVEIRTDLTALRAAHIETHAAIEGRIDRLQDVVTAQGADLIKTRADIMDRIDRMQNVLSLRHEEHIVDVGTLERVERMSKATREEVAGLAEIVTPMLRIIHTLRGQIDELFEAVRILKQGRAA